MPRLIMSLLMTSVMLVETAIADAETAVVVRDAVSRTGQAVSPGSMHSQLATAVLDALRKDPIVDLRSLDIRADDGIVTFTGSQSLLLASDRATYIAETVPGVRRVVNRLTIRQVREADTQRLESDVRYALLTDPATARNPIDASADPAGTVTLVGTVANHSERQLAEELVRGIAGVRSVTNRLRIAGARRPSDRQLVAAARQALAWDAYVDGSRVHVDAVDGVVMLAGSVNTAAQRRRSIALAWIDGAKKVDVSQLDVAGERIENTAGVMVPQTGFASDEQLATIIGRSLRADPRLRDSAIDVAVKQRLVILRGTVDNLLAQRVAVGLAHAVRGVHSVDNRLRVPATAQLFSDAEIEARIDRALERNAATRDAAIGIAVQDGAVLLEGEADNWLARQIAETVAASVRGVHDVENEIVVSKGAPARSFDPYVDLGVLARITR